MRRLAVTLALTVIAVLAGRAQTRIFPTPVPGLVVGSGNFFSPVVANLERAVALYREGLEIEGSAPPSTADDNAPLRNMFGLPEGRIRWSVARPAGLSGGIEIVEIAQPHGRLLTRGIQDPGAATLVVNVQNLERTLINLEAKGVRIVSVPPEPIDIIDNGTAFSAILVRDLDDHFIELRQPKERAFTLAPANANVMNAGVRLTVNSMARAVALYRDALGLLDGPAPAWKRSPPLLKLEGLRNGERQIASLTVPRTRLNIEFAEYRGLSRHGVRGNLQDPGSTRLQLQVRDLDAAIKAVVAAGGQVISTGGVVELPSGRGAPTRAAIVRDPNNLFLVLIAAQAPRP